MDMIHIFDTLVEAQNALDAIHAVAAAHYAALGYTVIQTEESVSGWRIISKVDGADDPEAYTDSLIDHPTEAPDGRFYLPSPDGLSLIPDWEVRLAARGVVIPEAVEMPSEWDGATWQEEEPDA